jgi:hypothetical protein
MTAVGIVIGGTSLVRYLPLTMPAVMAAVGTVVARAIEGVEQTDPAF